MTLISSQRNAGDAAETRFVVCQACNGDGGWSYFTGGYCRFTGAADEAWEVCNYCGGKCEEEIEVEPITLEDMEEAFG